MSDHTRPIEYDPGTAGDNHRFDMSRPWGWNGDVATDMGHADILGLTLSDRWEDRVRAAYLLRNRPVYLPGEFPCIYEVADSPNQVRNGALGRPHAWVVSPDLDMLTALLPEYQAMWDDYVLVMHPWWGDTARRVFAVGHLPHLEPHQLYRPGTTVDDVLRLTANLHGMRMPARLGGKQGVSR